MAYNLEIHISLTIREKVKQQPLVIWGKEERIFRKFIKLKFVYTI